MLDTDGKVIHPASGTTQGGIISPLLANVYLHYALDLWFQEAVKVHMKGEACLIHYADDFVCAFEYEEDAKAFFKVLGLRLEKFGLQLAADKTRVMHFSRSHQPGSTRFDFLGFEFRWDKDRAGKPHVARRTSREKLRNSIANFTEWCKQNRNVRLKLLFPQLNRKLRGYYNYYGVKGNAVGLQEFHGRAMEILLKGLNRRSQRRSFNWQGFKDLLDHFQVPRPRITDKPRVKTSAGVWQRVNTLSSASRASSPMRKRVFLKSPVRENRTPGFCAGAIGQLVVLRRCHSSAGRVERQPSDRSLRLGRARTKLSLGSFFPAVDCWATFVRLRIEIHPVQKILIIDDAVVPTGFARVIRSIFEPLHKDFELHQLATRYGAGRMTIPGNCIQQLKARASMDTTKSRR